MDDGEKEPKYILPLHHCYLHLLPGHDRSHILPKWLYTISAIAVVGMVEGFALLFKKQGNIRKKPLLAMVAFLCSIQAVYAIAQASGLCLS